MRGTQTIGGGCRRGGVAGGCHGVDGVEDGGEEVGVGEVRLDELAVRRWRWSTWVPASLGPPLALAVDGVGVGRRGRRGGAGVLPVG